MKKSKKNESITDNLFFIKKSLSNLSNGKEEINSEKIDTYVKAIDEIIILFKGLKRIILFLFFGIIICFGIIILMKIYDTKVENFNNEIKNYKTDSIVRKILDIKELTKNESIETSYNYLTKNGKIVTYNQLVNESDSLVKKLILKELEINSLKHKLDLAKKNYDINFFETKTAITIEAKKLDSALVLLDAFRDKMIYDKKSRKWTIKR